MGVQTPVSHTLRMHLDNVGMLGFQDESGMMSDFGQREMAKQAAGAKSGCVAPADRLRYLDTSKCTTSNQKQTCCLHKRFLIRYFVLFPYIHTCRQVIVSSVFLIGLSSCRQTGFGWQTKVVPKEHVFPFSQAR